MKTGALKKELWSESNHDFHHCISTACYALICGEWDAWQRSAPSKSFLHMLKNSKKSTFLESFNCKRMTHWWRSGTLWFGDSHRVHLPSRASLFGSEILEKHRKTDIKKKRTITAFLSSSEVVHHPSAFDYSDGLSVHVQTQACCNVPFLCYHFWSPLARNSLCGIFTHEWYHSHPLLDGGSQPLSNLRTFLFSFVFELAVTCCNLPCWLHTPLPQLCCYTATFPNSFTE